MTDEWLTTGLGSDLLSAEQALFTGVAEGVFGEFGLQLGCWGPLNAFTSTMRTQRTGVVVSRPVQGASLVSAPHQLAVQSDSVDFLLLPHTLDRCDRPQATLREAARVLRSDGQLVILAFKPGGLWGLRRLWPGTTYPPATQQLIAERHLTDWLELLDFRIMARQRYFFRWPWQQAARNSNNTYQNWGERFWPELAACYLLRAQKRLQTLTPVRPAWSRPKRVATLVKPSTRVARDAVQRRSPKN